MWEGKWEIDSLSWPVLMVFMYYANTRDRTIFTPTLHRAMQTIVSTLQCEQHHATCSHYSWPQPVPTNNTYNPDAGMIWSGFRPSDDPVTYRYNVPQNAIAVIAMKLLAVFVRDAFGDQKLASDAMTLAAQVQTGIERFGRTWVPNKGWMYVYETDGYGRDNLMDDANIPNLTTLPYIGWCATDDPVYLNTRRFTLSSADPYYYSGKYATGLGSPHTPKGWVWPIGMMGAALSTRRRAEIENAINMLDASDTLNGLMHESVNPNDPSQFTRPDFGWANAFWADLLFRTVAGYRAIGFVQLDTMTPFEPLSDIPSITPPFTQLDNTADINMTLGELLSQHSAL